MAAILRKNVNSIKEHLFPAIAQMMTEVTNADDLEEWLKEEETEL